MKNVLLILAFGLFATLAGAPAAGQETTRTPSGGASSQVAVDLYWSATCRQCARAKAFLEQMARRDPGIALRTTEVSADPASELAFIALTLHFGVDRRWCPLSWSANGPSPGMPTTGGPARGSPKRSQIAGPTAVPIWPRR